MRAINSTRRDRQGEDKVGEGWVRFGTWGRQQLPRSTWVKSDVLIHVPKGRPGKWVIRFGYESG